jgi:hypothetical protein
MAKLAFLPVIWGTVASAVVTENTGISIGLFIAGILTTATLVRWHFRDRQSLIDRMSSMELRLGKIEETQTEDESEADRG